MPLAPVCSEVRAALHAWLESSRMYYWLCAAKASCACCHDKHGRLAEEDLALVLVR